MTDIEETRSRTFPQYVAAFSASLSGLAVGALIGWSSPAQNRLTVGEYGFPVSNEEFSWITSAMTLGAACSCIPTGFLINIIGRKLTMLLLIAPFTLGCLLIICAQSTVWFYSARFILGLPCGAFFMVIPIYIGEIAHKNLRGRLASLFLFQLISSRVGTYVIGDFVTVFWMTVGCSIIPIIFGATFIFMPESPTYLISKEKEEATIKSIQWLRGKQYDYNHEIAELKEAEHEIRENQRTVMQTLLRRVTLKALCICFGLIFFQQLSGFNAFLFYQEDIFRQAQTGISTSLSSIIIGIVQITATFVSVMTIDKVGRRVLLVTSALIMGLSTTAIGAYFYMKANNSESVKTLNWLPVTVLCLFISAFSLGYGPIPWLMIGELFATNVKGLAASFALTFNWILAFVITKTFVNFQETIGTGQTYWLYTVFTITGAIFAFIFVPETKGKSLNEIQRILEDGLNVAKFLQRRAQQQSPTT